MLVAGSGVSMQLYKDGVLQGKGMRAVPFAPAPDCLPENIPGYMGFDPLGLSTLCNVEWLREAEIKHCRVAMLAAAGSIAQDLYQFPVIPFSPPAASKMTPFRPSVSQQQRISVLLA